MCKLLIESKSRIGRGPGEKSDEHLMGLSGRRVLFGPGWRVRGNIWRHMVRMRMRLHISFFINDQD
jgi:hypothetical protein